METICINNGEIRLPKCVATLGVFDGVHKGHQHLIGMVAEQARVSGLRAAVVTFDRPPRQVLDASFHPQLLTTLEEKRDIISHMGVDYLVVLPFTKELAALTAREFMQQILHKQLNAAVLITGYDNRFGHHREEGFDDYVRYGEEMGMQAMRGDAELMTDGKEAVSSSIIRQLLL
jgi:riboflavin kinase/FMN adenylyltransferase